MLRTNLGFIIEPSLPRCDFKPTWKYCVETVKQKYLIVTQKYTQILAFFLLYFSHLFYSQFLWNELSQRVVPPTDSRLVYFVTTQTLNRELNIFVKENSGTDDFVIEYTQIFKELIAQRTHWLSESQQALPCLI